MLAARFPQTFVADSSRPHRPLKLGIDRDLVALGVLDEASATRTLRHYCSRLMYRRSARGWCRPGRPRWPSRRRGRDSARRARPTDRHPDGSFARRGGERRPLHERENRRECREGRRDTGNAGGCSNKAGAIQKAPRPVRAEGRGAGAQGGCVGLTRGRYGVDAHLIRRALRSHGLRDIKALGINPDLDRSWFRPRTVLASASRRSGHQSRIAFRRSGPLSALPIPTIMSEWSKVTKLIGA
jgi:ProQ/FINO family